jgi:hypothetical protein
MATMYLSSPRVELHLETFEPSPTPETVTVMIEQNSSSGGFSIHRVANKRRSPKEIVGSILDTPIGRLLPIIPRQYVLLDIKSFRSKKHLFEEYTS